jgi:hypothetical protein
MLSMVNAQGKPEMNAMTAILEMPNDLPFTVAAPKPTVVYSEVTDHTAHAMRGQLEDRADIVKFLEAGNATVTIVSKKSGTRYTFKFSRPKVEASRSRPIWVSILSGQNNDNDYTFAGTIWINAPGYAFNLGRESTIKATAPSMLLLSWFLKHLNAGSDAALTRQAEFWHEGRCGRCGRTLTVPGSIASGFGPECITKV